MTLHVGSEVLSAPVQRIPGRKSQLFATHKGGNLECHGRFDERMLFQPVRGPEIKIRRKTIIGWGGGGRGTRSATAGLIQGCCSNR